MAVQCTATTQKGEQCRQHSTVDASGLCLIHADDPTRKRQLAAARSRGGKATAAKGRRVLSVHEVPDLPKTVEDLAAWSLFLVWAAAVEKIEPRTSDSVVRAIKVAMDVLEGSDLRDRLTELESTFADARRSGMKVS